VLLSKFSCRIVIGDLHLYSLAFIYSYTVAMCVTKTKEINTCVLYSNKANIRKNRDNFHFQEALVGFVVEKSHLQRGFL